MGNDPKTKTGQEIREGFRQIAGHKYHRKDDDRKQNRIGKL